MWDLKVIVALNKVAHELAKAGKNPSGALSELYRRSQTKTEITDESDESASTASTSNPDRG